MKVVNNLMSYSFSTLSVFSCFNLNTKPSRLAVTLLTMMLSFALSACQSQIAEHNMTDKPINTQRFTAFERKIAQRMSLDIRYYCADIKGKPSVPSAKHCRQALTQLPDALAQLISATNLGGIVLFAENVQNTAQIINLTHDIQQAALKSVTEQPLIISIDQEGGRVARYTKMTGFAGNMAIGASYANHGTYFATQVNGIIAEELKSLGINNNYAPVVDVNTNVDNPVINTRSFGESAGQVAALGLSAVNAIQAQGVMATLKHFPGHGDTHVDSHLGLPRVDHDRATIDKVDLAPFAWAIKHSNPAMIMTAHIQYPALDDSYYVGKNGNRLMRPATMSRKILTKLLREDMAYQGIIATDALDMAGITYFFTDVEAVVETFVAGADLAVMPFKVRTAKDIVGFSDFIKKVAKALTKRIEAGDYQLAEFEQAISRLNSYKAQYIDLANESVVRKISAANKVIARLTHLNTEQALANAALTLLKNNSTNKSDNQSNSKNKGDKKSGSNVNDRLIPLALTTTKHVHLVVANRPELDALIYAINRTLTVNELTNVVLSYFIADDAQFNDAAVTRGQRVSESQQASDSPEISKADIVIATVDIKTASLVDLGGMDDLTLSYGSAAQQHKKLTYSTALKQQLILAHSLNIPSILIAKGSPFLIKEYSELADAVLLNFDDRIYTDEDGAMISPGFNASMAAIFDKLIISGNLPVTLF